MLHNHDNNIAFLIQRHICVCMHNHDNYMGFLIQRRHICVRMYSLGQSASQQLTAAWLPHMFTCALPSVRYQVSAAYAIPSLVSLCTHTNTHIHGLSSAASVDVSIFFRTNEF